MDSMFQSDETDLSWMFCNDSKLTTLTYLIHLILVTLLQSLILPNSFDTSNVTNMSGMFNNNYNQNH
ncbi:MAG: Hypothetical protein AJITA_00852 [Acetilactobacillus jinshanensis]